MEVMTINKLKKECEKQIALGNGDKVIMISDDDEGNGFHYLFYTFTPLEDFDNFKYGDICNINENIAKKEDTIILG